MTGDQPSTTWQYRPGNHWAVVGPSACGLLIGDSTLGLAQRIWMLLEDLDDGVERVLDEMAHDGVAGLPSFVLVERTGDGIRVLVRGTAVARLRGEDASSRDVSGVGFRSWREEAVSDVAGVLLTSMNNGGATEGPPLPVRGGIVRASEVSLQLVGTEDRRVAAPEAAADAAPPAPPEPAGPAADVRAPDPSLTLDQSVYDPDGEGLAAAPVAGLVPDPEPQGETEPERAAEPVADAERRPGHDYLELLAGMTRIGTVEDAAVRGPVEGDARAVEAQPPTSASPPSGTPAEDVAPAGVPETPEQAPAIPAAAEPADRQPRPAPGLISSVPFSSARPATSGSTPRHRGSQQKVPGRVAEPALEDEAELTVVRVHSGAGAGAAPARSGGLPAVVCSRAHANPPESERCRSCGEDLSDAERRWVEQPTIGRLRFDGPPGVVPVTGPMVIGRAPRADRVSGDAVPTMITVPGADGDISRSHLRIAVEGWHVLVVDLDATNGTVVHEPNGESRRLHPGEEKMIVPGSRVVLADTVGFVFEADG